MKSAKWVLVFAGMGLALSGCKKEQTTEAPPTEQPKAEAARPAKGGNSRSPQRLRLGRLRVRRRQQAHPAPTPKPGFDRALLRAALLKDKAPDTFK